VPPRWYDIAPQLVRRIDDYHFEIVYVPPESFLPRFRLRSPR